MRKNYTKIYQRNEKVIPIFYASDENYLPYLSISLDSVKTNRNKKYKYNIHILHTGIQDSKKEVILNMQEENFNIFFVDVNEKWHGPDAWRTEGINWSYEYVLRTTGILKAPGVS